MLRHLTKQSDVNPQLASELLQILSDIFDRYNRLLLTRPALQKSAMSSLRHILSHARISVRKRAVAAMTSLLTCCPDLFDADLKRMLIQGAGAKGEDGRIWTSLLTSLAKSRVVRSVGSMVSEGSICPKLIAQTEDTEDVESVEGALSVSP